MTAPFRKVLRPRRPIITELSITNWVWILLIYSFIASVMPVWLLLQPRDYLNSHQLVTALVFLTIGLMPSTWLPLVPCRRRRL